MFNDWKKITVGAWMALALALGLGDNALSAAAFPDAPVRVVVPYGAGGTGDMVARIDGKSSLGRLGLLIHSTAGFVDPSWVGNLTLELSNVANLPITIYYRMKIGQISFMRMTEPASAPYGSDTTGSKYQGQRGPTPSRYWQNFES